MVLTSGTLGNRYWKLVEDFGRALAPFEHERTVEYEAVSHEGVLGYCDGEPMELQTDLAWIGSHDATKVIMVISGTHGIEGFFGSEAIHRLLGSSVTKDLSEDVAFLFVHNLNAWGVASWRRVCEGNQDLNRNFAAHPHPSASNINPDYGAFSDLVVPRGGVTANAWGQLDAKLQEVGMGPALKAIASGQNMDPNGLFFAGWAAASARMAYVQVLRNLPKNVQELVVIDLHSGLGPFGVGTLGSAVTDLSDPQLARAKKIFGDAIDTPLANAGGGVIDYEAKGDLLSFTAECLPSIEITAVVLEFGVLPPDQALRALCAEASWHAYGSLPGYEGPGFNEAKQLLANAFYPSADRAWDWWAMVQPRTIEVVSQALGGLSS